MIKENKFTKINISDYFVGENWKIHPDWVYCKYHYLEGHEFDSPELELKEFLRKIFEPDWKWSEQYEPDDEVDTEECEFRLFLFSDIFGVKTFSSILLFRLIMVLMKSY